VVVAGVEGYLLKLDGTVVRPDHVIDSIAELPTLDEKLGR